MSWYFFGGFSAYAIVPSGRVVNHSGCSVTHGWSGRALQCEVERDLHAELVGALRRTREVLDRAEFRVDRVVAAFVGADRPRRADVGLARRQRVVAALAVDPADRVDRRQVDDVEAHVGDPLELLGGGGERAVNGLPVSSSRR